LQKFGRRTSWSSQASKGVYREFRNEAAAQSAVTKTTMCSLHRTRTKKSLQKYLFVVRVSW
jgi:hypothetical protein